MVTAQQVLRQCRNNVVERSFTTLRVAHKLLIVHCHLLSNIHCTYLVIHSVHANTYTSSTVETLSAGHVVTILFMYHQTSVSVCVNCYLVSCILYYPLLCIWEYFQHNAQNVHNNMKYSHSTCTTTHPYVTGVSGATPGVAEATCNLISGLYKSGSESMKWC